MRKEITMQTKNKTLMTIVGLTFSIMVAAPAMAEQLQFQQGHAAASTPARINMP